MSIPVERPVPIKPVQGGTDTRVVVTAEDVLESSTTLEDVTIAGIALRAAIIERVLAADIEWTIEGASTVTLQVHDPDWRLRNSGILHRETKLTFAGQSFVLVKEGGKGSNCKLVFEDFVVSQLRSNRRPKRAARGKVTRGQFMVGMVREARPRIITVAPEQNVMLALGSAKENREPGFPPKVKLTVKGKRATAEQLKVLADVLAVGVALKAPGRVNEAAIVTVIQESVARNLRGGDRDSAGAFQQRPSQGWGTLAQVRNVRYAARSFYTKAIAYHRTHKSASVGAIAQHVQRSAYPSAYARWAKEATAILKAYVPAGEGGSTGGALKRIEYTRGMPGGPRGENSWEALLRLADEVGWRRWAYRGRVYIMSEVYLYRSRAWATIRPDDEFLLEPPDYDVDVGKRAAEVTLTVRSGRWATPPGAIIALEGFGRALDGRWLVSKAGRPLIGDGASIATVTLTKPRPELPEPVEAADSNGGALPAALKRMLTKAKSISDKRWAYKWGGGHGSFAGPYDCSGAVSAVLNAGGFLSTPQTTVGLASFGEAGEGTYVTVWVKNVANMREAHVFLEIKEPGKAARHWGTGNWGSGFTGAGYKPQMHSKSGFKPRHPKGL